MQTPSYDYWVTYLAGGRKKYERTLYDRGYRIQYANNGDIEIVMPWMNRHPLITIHPNDTKTIQCPTSYPTRWGGTWNPLSAYSVRYTIWKYAGIEVVQRNFKFRLYEENAGYTPSKIQGCRMCKQSGKINYICWPGHCWNLNDDLTCPSHPDLDQSLISPNQRWHRQPCEHGSTDKHTVIKGQQCYSCGGAGKREYGKQRMYVPWDGSPITINNGSVVYKSSPIVITPVQLNQDDSEMSLERMIDEYCH